MTGTLDQQLIALSSMSPAQLRSSWRETFRSMAPDIGPDLLHRGIAMRLQERVHGKLPPKIMREIARLQLRLEKTGKVGPMHAISLKTGTRLVREWNAKTYHVLVCDKGFEHDGRHYESLSQIAAAITGAHWSGPRFFGLTDRKKKPIQNSYQAQELCAVSTHG
jgi:hypothetical protein